MRKFLSIKPLLTFLIIVSVPSVQLIQAKTIEYAEYFIDTDPGQGFGTPLSACDGTLDEATECLYLNSISSDLLTEGSHTLFVRIKDSDNVWGTIRKLTFNVIEASAYKILDTAEYFIDTDPGVGLGIPLSADDGAFDESAEDAHKNTISTSSLSPGGHSVYVRFRDNWWHGPTFNGWGPTSNTILCVVQKPQIVYPINDSGPDWVTLKWVALDSVDSYEVHISKSMVFHDTLRLLSSPTESLTVAGLPHAIYVWWRVRGIYACGSGVWSDSGRYYVSPTDVQETTEEEMLPSTFQLSQNYPNPFNPITNIRFMLPKSGHVKLDIFDILGRRVRTLVDEKLLAGHKLVTWEGRDDLGREVGSGVYFCKLKVGDYTETKKMILMK